jgi:hypothetical protein
MLMALRTDPNDPSVPEQLKALVVAVLRATMHRPSALHILIVFASQGKVPPPPNSDVDLETYIRIVLRRSERAGAAKVGAPGTPLYATH